ncbi:MAG TPA: ribosome biogenesis GTPase Der [Candidatus Butyricicoccus avistercoris]|uniref:GTPase Der n=1 Tax=Candidatus Butyricicoccus avistercoris TaxID=2838518 RepID=A0A9D1PIA5_9FIRM|nr:ribosome biogenesis GTPase Der [Candidatus Butyricicoccus avistercoris]
MSKPIVAIVGRPNVGKSQLFNRLAGKRLSIVEDTPGVTRDRLYADSEWRGRSFSVIDTGGIEPRNDNEILKFMRYQAEAAIHHADVIIFITDLRTGVTASDEEVASMLQRSGKPIVLAVNKCDKPGAPDPNIFEFYNLGLGEPYGISALHGYGTGDMLDAVYEHFSEESENDEDDDRIRIALIGKPNVGKSSLLNRVLGEERVIVSNVAGTTRDSVDADIENEYGKFTFIDTAGIRKKSKIEEKIEKFSVMRSLMSVERADVCVIMIDAQEGVTEQDTKVAGEAHNAGKACIIVVNKWDTVEKDGSTMKEYTLRVREGLAYMPYAPVLFISAKTGQRLDKLYSLIAEVYEQNHKRIPTGQLNSILAEATSRVQPPTDKGRRLKIYYVTQAGVTPPTFIFFCNDAKLFHFSYQRYLENQIREVFSLTGTPVRIVVRQRGDKEM